MLAQTQTLSSVPGHALSLGVSPSPNHLVVTLTDATDFDSASDPRRLDNVMVWVDGRLIVQWYDWMLTPQWHGQAFSRVQVDARTVRYTLDLDLGIDPLDDGDHQITVGAFQADAGDAGYLQAGFYRPPANVPAVLPGRIPRVAFLADPDFFRADPALLANYVAAGFNCVMSGFFQNPGGNAALKDYDTWAASNLPWFQAKLDWCRANGLLFWGTGDDLCRFPYERDWINGTAWAEQAVRAVFALARKYPEWVAVSMVDEMGGGVADDPAYLKIVGWARAEGAPPLSWPNRWDTRDAAWEAPAVADFADRYYSLDTLTWRDGLYRQGTNWQYAIEIAKTAATVRTGLPLAYEVSGCGAFYRKKTAGGTDYQPGDDLINAGVTPLQAVLSVWLPLAYGASALRLYALDTPLWSGQRAGDPADGTHEEQTGLQFGTPVGDAIGHAMRAVARYEGALLGGFRTPLTVGPWVVGRRSSGLQFWVNTADTPQACPVSVGREVITPTGPAAFAGPVGPGCVVIV